MLQRYLSASSYLSVFKGRIRANENSLLASNQLVTKTFIFVRMFYTVLESIQYSQIS